MKRTIEWIAFLVVVLGLWYIAGPSAFGGPASYVVVDGESMEPTYVDGDLVVAYERSDYAVGDVIVYDAPVDNQFNVIHRITEPTDGGFVTQGDNMEREDGWIAPHEEIYGAALFHVPHGGTVIEFLRQPHVIGSLLAGWAFFLVLQAAEKREGRAQEDDADPSDDAEPSDDTHGRTVTPDSSFTARDRP